MHAFFTMVGVLPGSAAAIDYVTEQLGRQLASEGEPQPAS
jgi:hypothetical protein